MEAAYIPEQLMKLGYTGLWLDYGVLTLETLAQQYHTIQTDDDQNTEHYRYGTFRQYLVNNATLTDEQLNNYLQLIHADEDNMMASAAAQDLFALVHLTDAQFKKTCHEISRFDGEWTKRLITRQQLIRRIKNHGLKRTIFAAGLREGDGVVQQLMLEEADFEQLQQLAAQGVTNKVRTLATQELQRVSRLKR